MDKPTIKQHTTPRAARQGGTAGASFLAIDLETDCHIAGAVISYKVGRKFSRRGAKRQRAAYIYAFTRTGRLTGPQNVQTLTKRPKRGQYL